MANTFTFELVSPEKLLLSVDAEAVSVPGADGDFTVLANIAPTMANVQPGVVEVTDAKGDKTNYFVNGGLIDCAPNAITLLAEFAAEASEVDDTFFETQKSLAQEKLEGAKASGDEARITAASALVSRIEHLQSVN